MIRFAELCLVLVQALAAAGADALCIETLTDLEEARAALRGCLRACTLPAGVTDDQWCMALLEQTGQFPTTSQPSAGDFADLYRRQFQRR